MMKNFLGIIALCLVFACNSNTDKTANKQDTTTNATAIAAITPSFESDTLQNLFNSYIQLKDALVATKFDDAKQKASLLANELKIKSGCENTALIAQNIANAKDIETQRKQFTALNSDIIALFKHAQLKAGSIFVQRCPMANNGDGGEWLASEKKIQNPYYGSEMMECGAVLEEIKSK